MHPGSVSEIPAIAAKSRRCAVPSGRVTTRAKKAARFSTSPSGVIFESGQSFLGHNFTGSEHLRKPNTLSKFSGFVFLNVEMARSKNPAERSRLKTQCFSNEPPTVRLNAGLSTL